MSILFLCKGAVKSSGLKSPLTLKQILSVDNNNIYVILDIYSLHSIYMYHICIIYLCIILYIISIYPHIKYIYINTCIYILL